MKLYNPMNRTSGRLSALSALLTAAALPLVQGCLNDGGGGKHSNKLDHTLYVAQEGSLVAYDIQSGDQIPGEIADVKAPTDLQALEDGTLIVNLTGSNEILAIDGKTMLEKARVKSSQGQSERPVHSFVTPGLNGKQYFMSTNDGPASANVAEKNSAHFLNADPDSKDFLKFAGEVTLGVGHHKATFSPDKERVVISNIADCKNVMSIYDYSDIENIQTLATLDAPGAGYNGPDSANTCSDNAAVKGISLSPHGCATAENSAHAFCNLTGPGVILAVDLDAGSPSFKTIPTKGSGGGYSSPHPGGRYVYSLQGNPKEGAKEGKACQVGQVAVLDGDKDELVAELPLFYKGPDCTDSLKGTPQEKTGVSHILFNHDGSKAFVNVASNAAVTGNLVDLQLVLDLGDPAHPKQESSLKIGASSGSHGENISGDGKWLFVANNKDGTVSVIDAMDATVKGEIKVNNAGKTLTTYGTEEGPGHQVGPFH